jgi:hypothetical protein
MVIKELKWVFNPENGFQNCGDYEIDNYGYTLTYKNVLVSISAHQLSFQEKMRSLKQAALKHANSSLEDKCS